MAKLVLSVAPRLETATGLDHPDLAAWEPSGNDIWDRPKAAHLLRRAGFGGTPEEIDTVVSLGMNRAVDLILAADNTELQAFGTVVLANGEVLNLTSNLASQRAQWIWECVTTQSPLKEKMALFWHDHFSVGVEAITAVPLLVPHVNIFRRLGLGSFRQMLLDVTRDPAMLLWLDNNLNGRGGRINENYSRELFELYTMGVDNGYVQTDVVEAAKCLSGWTLNGINEPTYLASQHINGAKTVLGRVINNTDGRNDLPDLIDLILARSETGRYVGGKIWAYFVSENPEPAIIDALAQQWQSDQYNIRALMSTILRSRYFYGPNAMRMLVKNPMEFVVGAIRNTGVTPVGRYSTLATRVQSMGLPLLRYTNPAGLDDGIAWLNSQALIARANFANELTQVSRTAGIRPIFDPRREIRVRGLATSQQVVDHYLAYFVDDDVPALVRWTLNEFLNRNDSGPAPFAPNTTAGDLKMRGFVHALLSLPEYQIN